MIFTIGPKSSHFREKIRSYNSMFSFTSMGGKVDVSINQTRGPRTFRLFGQNYHQIGSLLPPEGSTPKFAQLYIYDTENEVANRISAVSCGQDVNKLHAEIVADLKQMLDDNNVLAKTFRMVRDRFQENNNSNVKLKLIGKRGTDGRRYNLPTIPEVAALVVGDFDVSGCDRDIVIETQSGQLQRINELNAAYLALQYPLLFPYGEDGYREDILLSTCDESSGKRQYLRSGEIYYLRLLLNVIKGPTSYEELRRINNYDHPTFRDACYALGLLDDDKEYIEAIKEASTWGMASYLRQLFVMLLLSNTMSRPEFVWEASWLLLSEDILSEERTLLDNPELDLTEDELKNRCLQKLDKILKGCGKDFNDYPTMPRPYYSEEEVDGDGKTEHFTDGIEKVKIPDDLLIHNCDDPISGIVESTYSNYLTHSTDMKYLQERAILAPTLQMVESVNDYMVSLNHSLDKSYLSSDKICMSDHAFTSLEHVHTPEFLNSIKCSGIPNHSITLK
ncbi:hypothetical protein H5410_022102, partial [Solanum commersonii]